MKREFEVTLRRDSRGGGRLKELKGSARAFAPHTRLVLLVHGYNVSADQAAESFAPFEQALSRIAPSIANEICRVVWPGDWRTPVIRNLAYASRLKEARKCAFDLARYINERKDLGGAPSQIVIVAHSLGCRLVLEALYELRTFEPPGHRRILLILMAAAVRVGIVDFGGDLSSAVTMPAKSIVLYSGADAVLRYGFPLGEHVAEGDWLHTVEAVGLRGQPTAVWGDNRIELKGSGHGDYWQSEDVHHIVCASLGFPVMRPAQAHAIVERGLTFDQRSLPERDLQGW